MLCIALRRCWSAHAFGRVITAYLSGWLVGKLGPRPVFVATATFPLIVCASSCLIRESRTHSAAQHGGSYDLVASSDAQQQQQQQLTSATPPATASEAPAAAAAAAGALQQHTELLSGGGGGPGTPVISRQGSAEVLRGSQLLLSQGGHLHQLHHKQRHNGSSTASLLPQQQHQQLSASPVTPTAPAAAAAAGDGSGGWGVEGSSSSHARSSSGSGGVRGRGWGCLWQAWGSVSHSVGLFWGAVKQPHLLRPMVFLFLLQVRWVVAGVDFLL
jgi:hypothetical protein